MRYIAYRASSQREMHALRAAVTSESSKPINQGGSRKIVELSQSGSDVVDDQYHPGTCRITRTQPPLRKRRLELPNRPFDAFGLIDRDVGANMRQARQGSNATCIAIDQVQVRLFG